ncbi:MAG: DUF494 domain-containing protein [Gammaproteobacteria bacterium]|nr:DUF494 domain-containing protein [Gammaproteobacteria bacterium]
MKENILDVLMYLFENYMTEDLDTAKDEASLRTELQKAGFAQLQISKAFTWLEGLAALQGEPHTPPPGKRIPMRIYTQAEIDKLDVESRGFLTFLENTGVLDLTSREVVIDRVMALDSEDVDLDHLKWVVLMVLFNQPGREEAYAWMEDYVFEHSAGSIH